MLLWKLTVCFVSVKAHSNITVIVISISSSAWLDEINITVAEILFVLYGGIEYIQLIRHSFFWKPPNTYYISQLCPQISSVVVTYADWARIHSIQAKIFTHLEVCKPNECWSTVCCTIEMSEDIRKEFEITPLVVCCLCIAISFYNSTF